MANATDKFARIFALLESVNFAMVRDEFESACSWQKIAAGKNALEVALNFTRRFVPHKAITADDLEISMIVLTAIAEVAVNKVPSTICRPRLFATAR